MDVTDDFINSLETKPNHDFLRVYFNIYNDESATDFASKIDLKDLHKKLNFCDYIILLDNDEMLIYLINGLKKVTLEKGHYKIDNSGKFRSIEYY